LPNDQAEKLKPLNHTKKILTVLFQMTKKIDQQCSEVKLKTTL